MNWNPLEFLQEPPEPKSIACKCGHSISSHLYGCHAKVGELTCRCNSFTSPSICPDCHLTKPCECD